MSEWAELALAYPDWLKANAVVRVEDERADVSYPFLDHISDWLGYVLTRENGRYVVTDDGAALVEAFMCGIDTESGAFARALQRADLIFDVERIDDALVVRADVQDIAEAQHCLLQAMMLLDAAIQLDPPAQRRSQFRSEVGRWLNANEVLYEPNLKIPGCSGVQRRFDYRIQSTDRIGHLVSALGSPTGAAAEAAAFRWQDIRDARGEELVGVTLLNDRDGKAPSDIYKTLEYSDLHPIAWSDRDRFLAMLAS